VIERCLVAAGVALLVCACAHAPVDTPAPPFATPLDLGVPMLEALRVNRPESDVVVDARVIGVDRAPGCGIFKSGSPVTYVVVASAWPQRGTNPMLPVGVIFRAFVPCIELRGGLHEGTARDFEPGQVHRVLASRRNVHAIEAPNVLLSSDDYYLVAAWTLVQPD
jgi:hypothetical protein